MIPFLLVLALIVLACIAIIKEFFSWNKFSFRTIFQALTVVTLCIVIIHQQNEIKLLKTTLNSCIDIIGHYTHAVEV